MVPKFQIPLVKQLIEYAISFK